MFKKLFTIISLSALLLCACAKLDDFNSLKDDLGRIEQRVTDLEARCTQMNADITSLKTIVDALNSANYVTDIKEVKEGDVVVSYTITFKTGKPITINIAKDGKDGKDGENGKDGVSPVIGVKEDGGVYYWTLNGEFILDNTGKKLPVTSIGGSGATGQDGITPKLKIEEGFWYVSYDNGKTWEKLASAQGPAGDSMFKAVTPGDGFITIELYNGQKISLPIYVPVTLKLDKEEILAKAGDEIVVNYTLSGEVNSKMIVTVATDGYYKAKVAATDGSTGTITIICPDPLTPGIINVNVFDGKSYVATKLISIKQDSTIEGVYSLKAQWVYSFSLNKQYLTLMDPQTKSWDFNNVAKEKDNKLILKTTGYDNGNEIGEAEYTAGSDGEYWDYMYKGKGIIHTTEETVDLSELYGFLPHGKSGYVYDAKQNKITFTQGEKSVTIDYLPAGKYTYNNEKIAGKQKELEVISMALSFATPTAYLTQFEQLDGAGYLTGTDADWLLYWVKSYIMVFSKD